jgi:hypothetical protein
MSTTAPHEIQEDGYCVVPAATSPPPVVTPPFLTRMETAKVVAARANMVSAGARPMVDPTPFASSGFVDVVALAQAEVREPGLLAMMSVERHGPFGGSAVISLTEMEK